MIAGGGLLLIGLLLATAAVQARDRASAAAQARDALTAEIEERTAADDRLERQLESGPGGRRGGPSGRLAPHRRGHQARRALTRLEAVTGAAPCGSRARRPPRGRPDDPADADADPRTDDVTQGRVTDRDLQTVVNEVWAAGAEAVAINGQRLTALSAIRPPGRRSWWTSARSARRTRCWPSGPDAMRTRIVEGFGGSYLQVLRDYGIEFDVQTRDRSGCRRRPVSPFATRSVLPPYAPKDPGPGTRGPRARRPK